MTQNRLKRATQKGTLVAGEQWRVSDRWEGSSDRSSEGWYAGELGFRGVKMCEVKGQNEPFLG